MPSKMTDTACKKTSKPFCSLAYLAKSTISNDIRIVNGHNSFQPAKPQQPHVAATAKVHDHNAPALPTGAITNGDQQQSSDTANTANTLQGKHNGHSSSIANGHHQSVTDVFGEINEEQAQARDQVDGDIDPRRPWELSHGGYVRRVPPSLMTATQNGLNGHVSGFASLAKLNSLDCWDYTVELECLKGPQDLQLAAELGKTLLERNKELENLLKEHKNIVEDQAQEIVFLKKHTTALREVNDSRLKVYEQLEVGIQDLERTNHRLLVENTSDKKHIKTLLHNVETLEARSDELNKQLDDTRQALSTERRKNERLMEEKNSANGAGANARLRPTDSQQSAGNGGDNASEAGFDANTTAPENCSFAFQSPGQRNSTGVSGSSASGGGMLNSSGLDMSIVDAVGEDNEEIIKLVNDLETTKKAFLAEQQRCGELEEQLVAIIQENQTLQGRLAQTSTNEEMRSMHDELSILDEVRQGQMCSRCLRAVEDRATVNDEQSSIAPTEEGEEDDERSLLGLDSNRDDNASELSQAAYRGSGGSVSIKVSGRAPDSLDLNAAPASPNPYRDLVEKYEALLEVQRSSLARKSNAALSLAEEFQLSSGEYNNSAEKMLLQTDETVAASSNGDAASSCNGSLTHDATVTASNKNERNASARGRTPTEFSEAETSSSGYSDETSNKGTQTDDRPGYFLCSIGDGEDCKFSIYDDVSPIDSRFRSRPEYRELFKQIFAVLKKAAENKEEGEKLPLLDDTHPATVAGASSKVPPVTPANEEPPSEFGDDTQSITSSAMSEQSFAMSECITKLERKTAKKHIIEKNQENKPPGTATASSASTAQLITGTTAGGKQVQENGRVLTPLKREPLEYLSVGVGIKKKNRKKSRNFSTDRSESPVTLPSPPRFFVSSGKRRKDARPYVVSPMVADQSGSAVSGGRRGPKYEWNGSSMVIYNRSMNSPQHASGAGGLRGRELDFNNLEYRPGPVSQDLHKLKKLDLSYAEVLRRADACKHHHQQLPQHNQQHHTPNQQQQSRQRSRQQQHQQQYHQPHHHQQQQH